MDIVNSQPQKRDARGFTLIEMIVSLAIFATVVLIAVGALLSIIDANRKANELRVVMENLNFAIESIARNVRTGTDYGCGSSPGNCSNKTTLSFVNQEGKDVKYAFDFDSKAITRTVGGGDAAPITSSEVVIEDVHFWVTGAGVGGDGEQPRVLMTVQGLAGVVGKNETRFSLQTTISQRGTDPDE
jgi:prepilin-type N-terminal cleavage/methylation domain-containing protein